MFLSACCKSIEDGPFTDGQGRTVDLPEHRPGDDQ